MLLEMGPDTKIYTSKGESILHRILHCENKFQTSDVKLTVSLIDRIIKLGCDVDKACFCYYPCLVPLHRAIVICKIEIIECLLDHHVDYHVKYLFDGYTILHSSLMFSFNMSKEHCFGIIRMFVQHGMDINHPSSSGATLLHVCVYVGYADIIDDLITEFKAEVNARDMQGRTPIHYIVNGTFRLETVEVLINHGADINSVDNFGMSLLMRCVKYSCCIQDIRELLKNNPSINHLLLDNFGRSALHHAILCNFNDFKFGEKKEHILFLIEIGIPHDRTDKLGKSPFQYFDRWLEKENIKENLNRRIIERMKIILKDNLKFKLELNGHQQTIERSVEISSQSEDKLYNAVFHRDFEHIKCKIELTMQQLAVNLNANSSFRYTACLSGSVSEGTKVKNLMNLIICYLYMEWKNSLT